MTRILVSFLAGSLLTCAGAILADYQAGVMFIAGGIVLLIAQVALLSSVKRARAFARFIVAVCDAWQQKRPLVSAAGTASQVPDPAVSDLASALKNFGMQRKRAEAVALEAVAGGGTFEDMLRRATAQVRAN
jgi:hypothetical protein